MTLYLPLNIFALFDNEIEKKCFFKINKLHIFHFVFVSFSCVQSEKYENLRCLAL